MSVHFFTEDITHTLKEKNHIRNWIKQTIAEEGKKLKEINFILCSDNYLLEITQNYLKHDTFTDIITFDNSESGVFITGDIFISVERIRENAQKYAASERDELHRVIIHGALHLIGYTDKTKAHKNIMSSKEDLYISKRTF